MEKSKIISGFIESCIDIIAYRDTHTRNHSLGVGYLCGLLGDKLNLSRKDQEELQLSGKAHDIGKLSWDDTLHQSVKKNELEHFYGNIISAHPKIGADFLYHPINKAISSNNVPPQRWIGLILCHHWGYTREHQIYPPRDDMATMYFLESKLNCPPGDATMELMIGIIKVADSLDAAISERKYVANAMSKACSEISRGSGTIYHPQVASALEQCKEQLEELFYSNRLCPRAGCGVLEETGSEGDIKWKCNKCGIIIDDRDHWWRMMDIYQREATNNALKRLLNEQANIGA